VRQAGYSPRILELIELTPYHTKYFAHKLTKRCPSDSIKKLAAALVDAQIDLNLRIRHTCSPSMETSP